MHPEQQVGVEGVVAKPRDLVDPVDLFMHLVDSSRRIQGFLAGTERHGVGESKRSLHALPGVVFVEAGLPRSGQDQWVRGLHQQGPRPTEQHRRLAVHAPGDGSWPEQPCVGVGGRLCHHGHLL